MSLDRGKGKIAPFQNLIWKVLAFFSSKGRQRQNDANFPPTYVAFRTNIQQANDPTFQRQHIQFVGFHHTSSPSSRLMMSPRRRSHSHDVSSSSWGSLSASPMRLIMGGGSVMVLCLWIFSSFTFLQDINQQSSLRSHSNDQQVLIARQTAPIDLDATETEQKSPLLEMNNPRVREDLKIENAVAERRELQVTSSVETWPMQEAFYTSQYAAGDAETSTTIIFNVFKGPVEALRTQLESAASQKGVSPPEIWVMCFNSPQRSEYEAVVDEFKKKVANKVVFTVSDFNHKFHGRFLLAYMATTKYVLLVDDDKYIGENTVADYIGYMRKTPGVWGNNGHIRAPTFEGYKSWPTHFDTAVDTHAEVDYLCGMWFLEQSWLEYFAKERMPSWETAEDMHLSHVMRKYLNLNTYGGNVALGLPSPPRKNHAATVGKALDLREYIFDHQLGRGNKVANVEQPIDTLVYAETVEDIDNFIAKMESCKTAEAVEKPQLRAEEEEEEEPEPDVKSTAPWCAAGKTAAVFRGAKEQDVVGLIQAAERLCSVTQCEYLSVKPKIKHPIRYFNMREGYGQSDVEIPRQTSAADVLTSFVGVLNNILPQRIFVPDVSDVQWAEAEGEKKKNRLQIYHDTIRLAINIHKSSQTNPKWDNRDQATYPSGVQAYVLKHAAAAADETLDRDEESWEQSVKALLPAVSGFRSLEPKPQHQRRSRDTGKMGGVDKYPHPKYTWSPAGGWWHETKQWRNKTGVALGVMALVALPLALHSKRTVTKYPSEERRKVRASTD